MPPLTPEEMVTLVATTRNDVQRAEKKDKFINLMLDKQDYIAVKQIFKPKKVKYRGGVANEFKVQTGYRDSVQSTGPYERKSFGAEDSFEEVTYPMRYLTGDWTYDMIEVAAQKDNMAIISTIKNRRRNTILNFFVKLESHFWTLPTSFNTDDKWPFTLSHFVTRWPTGTTTEGFNGADPTATDGSTKACGGLATATDANWANWTAKYAAVSKTDLVAKIRKALLKTKFKCPISMPEYNRAVDTQGFYVNDQTFLDMADLAEQRNQNLGYDLALNAAMVQGRVPTYVPQLDDDTGYPFIAINWDQIIPYVQSDMWLKEVEPIRGGPDLHNVWVNNVDLWMNLAATDRRSHFILSKKSSTNSTS